MIKIGQKVKFKPFKGLQTGGLGDATNIVVTGTVKYINSRNRWFSVEYDDDSKMRISYNFDDIGKDVRLC